MTIPLDATTRPRLLSMYAGLRGGPIDDEGEPEEALDEAREALDDTDDDPDDPEPIEPAPSAELVALRAEVAELKREIATLKRRVRFEERHHACTKGDLEIAKRLAGRSAESLKAERLAHRRTRAELAKVPAPTAPGPARTPSLGEIADALAELGGS